MATTNHTVSNAGKLFSGNNYFAPYSDDFANYGTRGLLMPRLYFKNYGAILTADPNGVCESQSAVGAHSLTLNGALVTGGVAVFDVPRNVTIDSGGVDTATLTITGTDEYGQTLVETIQLNGTTEVVGDKAFKTITSVTSDGTISNGAFVGSGVKIGLPIALQTVADFISATLDGANSVPTLVAADATDPATATTGDVRGTVTFGTAPNDTRTYAVLYAISHENGKAAAFGVEQYAG